MSSSRSIVKIEGKKSKRVTYENKEFRNDIEAVYINEEFIEDNDDVCLTIFCSNPYDSCNATDRPQVVSNETFPSTPDKNLQNKVINKKKQNNQKIDFEMKNKTENSVHPSVSIKNGIFATSNSQDNITEALPTMNEQEKRIERRKIYEREYYRKKREKILKEREQLEERMYGLPIMSKREKSIEKRRKYRREYSRKKREKVQKEKQQLEELRKQQKRRTDELEKIRKLNEKSVAIQEEIFEISDSDDNSAEALPFNNNTENGPTSNTNVKCDICRRTFHSAEKFDVHKNTYHSGVRSYWDEICDRRKIYLREYYTKRREMVRNQQKQERTEKREKMRKKNLIRDSYLKLESMDIAEEISEMSNSADDSTEHVLPNETGDNLVSKSSLECDICGRILDSPQGVDFHKIVHTAEKFYKCEVCAEVFISEGLYENHKRNHSTKKLYKCSVCDESFWLNRELRAHALTHIPEHYKCAMCDKVYKHKSGLKIHMFVHVPAENGSVSCKIGTDVQSEESKLLGEENEEEIEIRYKCAQCAALFATQAALEAHTCVELTHKCSVCDKPCLNKLQLKMHLKMHFYNRIYGCTSCNLRFTTVKALKLHQVIHTGAAFYNCTICDQVFDSIMLFKEHNGKCHRHKATMKLTRPKAVRHMALKQSNNCDKCGLKFRKVTDLIEHQNRCEIVMTSLFS